MLMPMMLDFHHYVFYLSDGTRGLDESTGGAGELKFKFVELKRSAEEEQKHTHSVI